jgi:hypothetical protein
MSRRSRSAAKARRQEPDKTPRSSEAGAKSPVSSALRKWSLWAIGALFAFSAAGFFYLEQKHPGFIQEVVSGRNPPASTGVTKPEPAALADPSREPWCVLSNAALVMTGPAPPQPEGTRRMIARLERLAETANPTEVTFLGDRLIEWLRKNLMQPSQPTQRLRMRFELGIQLLQAGRTEAALREFQNIEDLAATNGPPLEARTREFLRLNRAIAMLRLGEQENCLLQHNAESCLLPLQPAGYHQLTRGSRGAIALLSEQLRQDPEDLRARWLLNIAHMTLGEYPDRVPAAWRIPPSVFASEYPLPRFANVAGALGLDVDDLAGGCILDDFDNDGFIDIVASAMSYRSQLRYFHNDGNGHFTERTVVAGLAGLTGGLNIQQTDYNNDGLLDVWVLRGGWQGKSGRMPNSLLRNNGDGTFTDVTEEAHLLSFHPTQTSVWFDYDGDGWLDVFIGNETTDEGDPDPCELYHNNRDGTFTECAAACGLAVQRFVKGIAWADYDHDGRPDLYLSCRTGGANILFHNEGPATSGPADPLHWKFRDVTRAAGLSDTNVVSFPTWFFDYDNDGWEDLFVSGYDASSVADVAADYLGLPQPASSPKLYHNNHDGTFTDVTRAVHLNRVCLTMGCNFGDLDNDGWLDFYLATGDPDLTMLVPNRMFRNGEGKVFQEVTTATGTGHLQKGHGVGFADLDNDGDQDVYLVAGGAYAGDNARNALFLNPGNTNHWLKLQLVGTRSNRAAIGARIEVTVRTPTGQRHIYKTVNSGGSFGSSPLRQEIGLGNATAITGVDIFWPATGKHQLLGELAMDRAYRFKEGEPDGVVLHLPRLYFNTAPAAPHQHAGQAPSAPAPPL